MKEEFQVKIAKIEKRISDLEIKPINHPASSEFTYSLPSVKSSTLDSQITWQAFRTQFDIVRFTNVWRDFVKDSQLIAFLQGSAAEILQGI
ncbi:uncharacterized protein NPIL_466831 [Nephila pilipes]|uniref:Uncharacterized protein n=1 Tax=Nephila pilipes TaxID=299642 RepID=A0A8X6U9Y4_NEPPI|nr:uncharacterized protein NPIL_466831 [Nephila pilipes]